MLARGRRQAERLGVINAQFLKAELGSLPLQGSSVDLIVSNCTINHAADKQAVWNEIARVLRPGGRFVVSDIYSLKPVPERYAKDPQAIAECWAGSITKKEYLGQIGAAGFADITVLEESEPYAKGEVEVVSWTILGVKPSGCCCST
jgi:ubiquinone/menaquinone biosynthesis C-methylase UbiE